MPYASGTVYPLSGTVKVWSPITSQWYTITQPTHIGEYWQVSTSLNSEAEFKPDHNTGKLTIRQLTNLEIVSAPTDQSMRVLDLADGFTYIFRAHVTDPNENQRRTPTGGAGIRG